MGQANNDQVEQSPPLITVNEEGQLIFLSRFEDRNTVKELLPQSRWLPNIKAWKLPNITDDNFKSFQKMFELFPFTQEAHEVLRGFEDRIRIFQDQIKTAWEIKSFEASMLTGVLPVKVKPYDHQIKAFEFAKTLDHSALLMEQGTGKTLVAIALAGHWYQQGEIKRVLVICPKTVMPEWERQFLEVANYPYRLETLTGSIEDRTNTLKNWPSNEDGLQVAVINYEATWRLEKELKAWDPDLVIADESQKIKNGRAEQTKAVTALGKQAKHRLILTGTPVTQSPLDVFSQYRFLDPRIFGYRFIPFRDRYAVMGGYGGYQIISYRNLEELAEKAHSIAFRATKKECLDLPDTIDQFVYAELEPEAWKLYEQMAEEAIIKLSETEQVTAPIILTELLRLQQIAGGFVSTSPNNQIHQISKAKLEAIRELLEELKENNKQVVIFARFIPEIKAITELVKDLGMSSFTLTGETTTENRGKGIAEFQKGNIQVVISQISTGGLGITLTAADTAIFYSTDFSLANYEQAKARLHRIGQKHPVTYIHILARGTIDEEIIQRLRSKQYIAKLVVDELRKLLSTPLFTNGDEADIIKLEKNTGGVNKMIYLDKAERPKRDNQQVVVGENKPYEGLKPGTPEWMECWRDHPALQKEMLEYAKGGRDEMVSATVDPSILAKAIQFNEEGLEEQIESLVKEVEEALIAEKFEDTKIEEIGKQETVKPKGRKTRIKKNKGEKDQDEKDHKEGEDKLEEPKGEVVTAVTLAKWLDVDEKKLRRWLRKHMNKPGAQWEWPQGSPEIEEITKAFRRF